jgi:tetratricopeptide (TPR) repeat protein
LTEARAHFQLAVDRHSSDPNVLFYLGHLKHEAGVRSTEVMPLLEQALFLNPELSDARLELAIVAAADGNYEKALAALKKITALRPENAYASAFTEAYCYVHLGKFTEARELAYQAQKLAANSSDQAKVFQMLDFISQHS